MPPLRRGRESLLPKLPLLIGATCAENRFCPSSCTATGGLGGDGGRFTTRRLLILTFLGWLVKPGSGLPYSWTEALVASDDASWNSLSGLGDAVVAMSFTIVTLYEQLGCTYSGVLFAYLINLYHNRVLGYVTLD